jgi:hypothetical protein
VSRHITLADYVTTAGNDESPPSLGVQIAAASEVKAGLHRVVAIDCPDDGRTLAYDGRCRICGGVSWMPAGYVDRHVLLRVRASGEEEAADK